MIGRKRSSQTPFSSCGDVRVLCPFEIPELVLTDADVKSNFGFLNGHKETHGTVLAEIAPPERSSRGVCEYGFYFATHASKRIYKKEEKTGGSQ